MAAKSAPTRLWTGFDSLRPRSVPAKAGTRSTLTTETTVPGAQPSARAGSLPGQGRRSLTLPGEVLPGGAIDVQHWTGLATPSVLGESPAG